MKKMVSGMVFFCLAIFIGATAAGAVDTTGLSETQKAELAMQVAKMKESGDSTIFNGIKKVGDIAGVGKQVGHEIGEAAKEVGVAADELLKTDVGKGIAFLIVWKVAGKDMVDVVNNGVGYITGFFLFITLLPIWFYLFRKMCVVKITRIEYPEKSFKKIKHFEYYDVKDGNMGNIRLLMLVVLLVMLICILLVMFG